VKPSLLLVMRVAESRLGGAAARTHDQIDMRDLVAVANQRLSDLRFRDFRH
jgi:hypothetical protein